MRKVEELKCWKTNVVEEFHRRIRHLLSKMGSSNSEVTLFLAQKCSKITKQICFYS